METQNNQQLYCTFVPHRNKVRLWKGMAYVGYLSKHKIHNDSVIHFHKSFNFYDLTELDFVIIEDNWDEFCAIKNK